MVNSVEHDPGGNHFLPPVRLAAKNELDDQIIFALAMANGGRGTRWLTATKIALAILDFLDRPHYKDRPSHWITGGEIRPRDNEKAKTTVFVIMRDGSTKFSIKVSAATRETLENELSTCGLISCKKEAARDWAKWILAGSPKQPTGNVEFN